MATASQRHKLEIRGYNSLGERKALSKVLTQHGSDSVPAVIELYGLWSSTDTITVNTDIGGGNVESVYSPSGDETAEEAATGLAAVINGKADHTATASVNHVQITKSTAGSVTVVSHVIS